MKILAFAASSSRNSINKTLVTHALRRLTEDLAPDADIETEILDLNDFEMPIYSIDRETDDGIPEEAKLFFTKIGSADALVISFAEHNGSYTAAFKNVFDWASRIDRKLYQDKPAVLLSASPGPGGAARLLSAAGAALPHFGGEVLAQLSVPSFGTNFDPDGGGLTDPEMRAELDRALTALIPGD